MFYIINSRNKRKKKDRFFVHLKILVAELYGFRTLISSPHELEKTKHVFIQPWVYKALNLLTRVSFFDLLDASGGLLATSRYVQ